MKKNYQKPEITVVEIEPEQALLSSSLARLGGIANEDEDGI